MEDLYNYMIWGDYNKRMEELANLAIPEKWSFGECNDYSILKNYLKYTFLKSVSYTHLTLPTIA